MSWSNRKRLLEIELRTIVNILQLNQQAFYKFKAISFVKL